MTGGTLAGPGRVAAIVVAVLAAIGIVLTLGISLGRTQLSEPVSTPVTGTPTPTRAASAAPAPARTKKPSPAVTSPAPAAAAPQESQAPAIAAPEPATPAIAPPRAQPVPLPPLQTVTPDLPCPADQGVTVSLTRATPRVNAGNIDLFEATITVENRIGVAVQLHPRLISFRQLRADGARMSAGSALLSDTYSVKPGRTEFIADGDLSAMNFYGSPVVEFSIESGFPVTLAPGNDSPYGYCAFASTVNGPPLRGHWAG